MRSVLATTNWDRRWPCRTITPSKGWPVFFSLALVLWVQAQSGISPPTPEQAYEKTLKQYQNLPAHPDAAWEHARSCFDLAEMATQDKIRARLALEGIHICQTLLTTGSNSAPARYYLALNLGQLARTKKLAALKLVDQMEQELKKAARLDPKFDYAGADRSLGLLYAEAPSWPASVGDKSKARHHLRQAVDLAPDYPENRLNLLEFRRKNDRALLENEIKTFENELPELRRKFNGSRWERSWSDWDRRWKKLSGETVQRSKSSGKG